MDLRIWSVWPAEIEDPLAIHAAADSDLPLQPEQERPLPWTVSETVGQRWGNVFNGQVVDVVRLEPDPLWPDRQRPAYVPAVPRDNVEPSSIGFWTCEGRFVTLSWVRVDHLPAAVMQRWVTGLRIPYLQGEIAHLRALLSGDVSPAVRAYHAPRLAALEAALAQAEREAVREGQPPRPVPAPSKGGNVPAAQMRLL